MAFKMKHLGGSPLKDHVAGHVKEYGPTTRTIVRNKEGGKTVTTKTPYVIKKTDLIDKGPDFKPTPEQTRRANERARRSKGVEELTYSSMGMKPIKTTGPSANVKVKARPVKPVNGPPPSKPDTPKRKKIRRNPPGRVIREGVRDVGEGIGAIGSAIGRGAENVVNNLFGARSIFRICKKCK